MTAPTSREELAGRALAAIAWLSGGSTWRDVAPWMDRVLGRALGMSTCARWHSTSIPELLELCEALETQARASQRARRLAVWLYPPTPEDGPYVAPAWLGVKTEAAGRRPAPQHTPPAHPPPAGRPKGHRCRARYCARWCPSSRLMCDEHWGMVPGRIAARVRTNFRPGQEIDMQPSGAYLDAVDAAVEAVAQAEMLAKSRFMNDRGRTNR